MLTSQIYKVCELTSTHRNVYNICCVPSTADTGCSIIGSTGSTTVKYRTDSRLLHTFIGLNHVIRLGDLLQHLRWRLKGMHDLSKLRKRAKVQIWRQKTQLVIMTYVWSWLRGWTPSCKKKLWKTLIKLLFAPGTSRDNSLKLKCSREKRPNILLWCKGN